MLIELRKGGDLGRTVGHLYKERLIFYCIKSLASVGV